MKLERINKSEQPDLKNYVLNGEWDLIETGLHQVCTTYPNMELPFTSIDLKLRWANTRVIITDYSQGEGVSPTIMD